MTLLAVLLLFNESNLAEFQMTEHYFAALEQKLDQLIKRLKQLEEQNRQLLSKNARLEEERAQLMHNSDATRTQVEAMLNRLKTLEKTR